jgi:hypothetical protein
MLVSVHLFRRPFISWAILCCLVLVPDFWGKCQKPSKLPVKVLYLLFLLSVKIDCWDSHKHVLYFLIYLLLATAAQTEA